ncbi:hypothetical protein [Thiohalorhabdus denitrificans]|nr:hypothetical protein [Thiohalorhabdus denitrificans]
MLEARIELAGTLFRLVACRVVAPEAAGWTEHSERGDNRELEWNPEAERDWYRQTNSPTFETLDPEEPRVEKTTLMERLDHWWWDAVLEMEAEDSIPLRLPGLEGAYVVIGFSRHGPPPRNAKGSLDGDPIAYEKHEPGLGQELLGVVEIGEGLLMDLWGIAGVEGNPERENNFLPASSRFEAKADRLSIQFGPSPKEGLLPALDFRGRHYLVTLRSITYKLDGVYDQ